MKEQKMAAQLRCRRFVLGEWLYRSQHSRNRLYRSRYIWVEASNSLSHRPLVSPRQALLHYSNLARNERAKMNAQKWRPNCVDAALYYESGFIGASTLVIDFIAVDLFVWKALDLLSLFPIL